VAASLEGGGDLITDELTLLVSESRHGDTGPNKNTKKVGKKRKVVTLSSFACCVEAESLTAATTTHYGARQSTILYAFSITTPNRGGAMIVTPCRW